MIIKAADADRTMDLDIKELQDGFEYEKICYLLNYKAGVTQQEKGFYTFYVKDKKDYNTDFQSKFLLSLKKYLLNSIVNYDDLSPIYESYIMNVSRQCSNDLDNNNDSVGDVITAPENMPDIDAFSRDSAFIYLDGEIILGHDDETHGDIISETFKTPFGSYRPDIEDIPHSQLAFGHIVGRIAFIDICDNCSNEDVAAAIKKNDNIDKVYTIPYLDNNSYKLLRLANKL